MHSVLRSTLLAGLTGTLMVSAAWAGIEMVPVPVPDPLPGGLVAPQPDASGAAPTARRRSRTSTGCGAIAVGAPAKGKKQEPPRTIATLGGFAAHPVTRDHEIGAAHADWPGFFARRAEQRFGGVAMHIMTGLGTVTGAKDEKTDEGGDVTQIGTGTALADLLPPSGRPARPAAPTSASPSAPGGSRSPTSRWTRSARPASSTGSSTCCRPASCGSARTCC